MNARFPPPGLLARFARLPPVVRAEIAATSWEVFSALLFISAVVPWAIADSITPATFAATLVVSSVTTRWFQRLGRWGLVLAAALRPLCWLIAMAPHLSGTTVWVATSGFGLMAGVLRRAIYRRVLRPFPAEPSPIELRSDLRAQLSENAAVVGIMGGHAMLLFSVAFLRTQSELVFRAWWQIVPVLGLLGTAGFTAAIAPTTDRVLAGLRAGSRGTPKTLRRALVQSVAIPKRLSQVNFWLWLLCIVVGTFYLRPGYLGPAPAQWEWADGLMTMAFGSLFAWGVSFYQRGWHEDTIRPVVLRLRQWTGEKQIVKPVSLRRRMLTQFGLPVLFALTVSLLSSIALYRSLAEGHSMREHFNAISALCASIALLLAAVFGVFLRASRQLSNPLIAVAGAANRVARGELDRPVPAVQGPREVTDLGRSVEDMRITLLSTIDELRAERASLESNVEKRTAELRTALDELKQAQTALIQGERLALIGQLVAGVAHEINNPLNAISGSVSSLDRVSDELQQILSAYRKASDALPDAKRDELAKLEQELDVDGAMDDLRGIGSVAKSATKRTVAIVANLRNFSRTDTEPEASDLHQGLRETMSLLKGQLRHSGITIIDDHADDLPLVTCRMGEINQVLMNLLTNAIHAVEESCERGKGKIATRTSHNARELSICVADNGHGVSAGDEQRIFDPFFTTKARGKGTGLGLSISAEIIRRHGGTLTMSPDGELGGACFTATLPLSQ